MTTPLQSPGQLLANLPGILGFYPHESVIFVAFHQGASPHRFTLGPVLRIDLDDLALLREVGTTLTDTDCDLVFAFVITQCDRGHVEQVVDRLFEAAENGEVDIQACWMARNILTGEPYRIAFGPEPVEDPDDVDQTDRSAWGSGEIAPVSQAQAMTPLLEHGQLPELTRQEAFDHFVRFNPHLSVDDADQLEGFAHRHAADLVAVIRGERRPHGPGFARRGNASWEILRSLLDDHALLLDELAEEKRHTGEITGRLMADEETLVGVAVLLSDSLLRDAVLVDTLRRPGAAVDLFLAVARTFGGEIRANALSYYALAAVQMRLSMRAIPALTAALQEMPGHSLSALVLQSCRAGAFEEVLSAAARGSHIVRSRYARLDDEGNGVDDNANTPDTSASGVFSVEGDQTVVRGDAA